MSTIKKFNLFCCSNFLTFVTKSRFHRITALSWLIGHLAGQMIISVRMTKDFLDFWHESSSLCQFLNMWRTSSEWIMKIGDSLTLSEVYARIWRKISRTFLYFKRSIWQKDIRSSIGRSCDVRDIFLKNISKFDEVWHILHHVLTHFTGPTFHWWDCF